MTVHKLFTSESEIFTLKSALIGDRQFLGYFLEQLLQKQGSLITSQSADLDYIFFLWTDQSEFVRTINLASKTKAKLLIQIPLAEVKILHTLLTTPGLEQIDYRIVITAEIYGPRMVITNFRNLLSNSQPNDYLFVTDVVYGIAKAMFTAGTSGKVFWLGRSNPPFIPGTHIAVLVGWLPRFNFTDGISQTKDYFAKNKIRNEGKSQSQSEFLSPLRPVTENLDSDSWIVRRLTEPSRVKTNPETESQPVIGKPLDLRNNFQESTQNTNYIKLPSENQPITKVFAEEGTSLVSRKIDSGISLTRDEREQKNFGRIVNQPRLNHFEENKPPPKPDFLSLEADRVSKDNKNFVSNKIIFCILLVLLILSLLFTSVNGYLIYRGLKNGQKYLIEGNFVKAGEEVQKSKKSLRLLSPIINTVTEGLAQIKLTYPAQKIQQYLNLASTANDLLINASNSGQSAQKLADIVLNKNQQQGGEKQTINDLANSLAEDYTNFSDLQILAKNTRFEDQVGQLASVKAQILLAQQAVTIMPDILGLNQRKNYLILLQNNSELRPTGGFIGSFALITFDKARMVDFQVQDVYWADGQIQGHVEPPAKLKQYLGEASWYLRDSNWDPDFPTSASRAAWFLEKETGRNVDGVIGVNMYLAQNLLESIGEINLVDFNEKINAQNLFERAEYHSEINFFPGSTQKQDFLGSLARSLMEQLKSSSPNTSLNIASALINNITQKDLLFYFNNKTLEQQMIALDWAGELKKPICPINNCLADNLMVVDANVGINKANYFVKRTINQYISIDPGGTPMEKTTLTYVNNSQSESFPAGRYKSYTRFYLPDSAVFDYLQIKKADGGLVRSLSEKEVDLSIEHKHQVIGFLLEVPIQDKRTVEIAYHLSHKINSGISKYLFMLQKQSGIIDESLNFNFSTEPNFTIENVLPVGKLEKNSYTFQSKLDRDMFWEIDLQH